MSVLPFRDTDLAEQAAAFATKIKLPRSRWSYCFSRASYRYESRDGEKVVCINERTVKACARVLGVSTSRASFNLHRIKALGLDGAIAEAQLRPSVTGRSRYWVGPMEAWHVGHVYFARVASHPHVVKIGFSRRVRDRLEDIESANGIALVVRDGGLKVGTLPDEQWWHHNWRQLRIEGEWFFDPRSSDRDLPEFLRKPAHAEAA